MTHPLPAPSPATDRLYLQDARRKTTLASVTAHASGGFTLDRTILHAPDARYHHRQPCDRGHALVEGSKLKIPKVQWDAKARLVHRTTGPLPRVGAKAQLHLDAPRREEQARAHTLLHLMIQALAEQRAQHLSPPEVVGAGEAKAHVRMRAEPAAVAKRVEQLAAERAPVEVAWMTREDLARIATAQHVPLDAVMPGEPTLRVVKIGACILPCDAPLVEHAWQVGTRSASESEAWPKPGRALRWAIEKARDGVRVRARVG